MTSSRCGHLRRVAHPTVSGEIAVWRAAVGVDRRDPRQTGPAQFPLDAREWQQYLDRSVAAATFTGDANCPDGWAMPTVRPSIGRLSEDRQASAGRRTPPKFTYSPGR